MLWLDMVRYVRNSISSLSKQNMTDHDISSIYETTQFHDNYNNITITSWFKNSIILNYSNAKNAAV